jgi:hypothetical protein
MLTVVSSGSVLGTIRLTDGKLIASSPAIRSMIRVAMRNASGDAQQAYSALSRTNNGYLAVIELPQQTAGLAVQLGWNPAEPRDPATGKWIRAGFDWGALTHGRYDVPTVAVRALRQHDQTSSGKYPHLAEQVAREGIREPLEVSLHDDGRVVLRGGSHRVNIAHKLGWPTVPVQVVDMRTSGLAGQLAGQIIELDWKDNWLHEKRDASGRWTRGNGGPSPQSSIYPDMPEARGTPRGKGTFGGQAGRDLEDAARLRAYRREHPVQPSPITAAEARGNSRPVTWDEYQEIAAKGLDRLGQLSRQTPHDGLTRHWDEIKAKTYTQVQEPWGGATIDAHTGEPLATDADKYAISVKPAGMGTVSVPEDASEEEFAAAMDRALAEFGPELQRQQRSLGVFHDDENHRIDIDPVLVVDSLAEVEQIGSFTRAIGGAYHFKTGDGSWPVHVGGSVSY